MQIGFEVTPDENASIEPLRYLIFSLPNVKFTTETRKSSNLLVGDRFPFFASSGDVGFGGRRRNTPTRRDDLRAEQNQTENHSFPVRRRRSAERSARIPRKREKTTTRRRFEVDRRSMEQKRRTRCSRRVTARRQGGTE